MKKIFFLLAAILGLTQSALAADYKYVSAEELKEWLETDRPALLVDIQEKKDFAAHHIKGSLETNGYPVKSDDERRRLDPAVQQEKAADYDAVVVVCPRGKGGAKRAYDYLAEQGLPEAKLHILTGGMEKWPFQDWVEKP